MKGNNDMENDVKQMTKVKEWPQDDFFEAIDLEQQEDKSLGCLPIKEIEEILNMLTDWE